MFNFKERGKILSQFEYIRGRIRIIITYLIEKRIVEVIREEIYPPESVFKKKFIKSVKEAEKRIKQGKGKTYSYKEFKKKFLGK